MYNYNNLTAGSPSSPHVLFFHGLFGAKEDWLEVFEELCQDYYCIAIDLPCDSSLQQMIIPQNISLVGYSLGGRLALQLHPFAKKCVLISAHLGITSEEERLSRQSWQTQWEHNFRTLSPTDFFKQWYDQPLFSSLQDHPALKQQLIAKRSHQSQLRSLPLFLEFSLLHQPPLQKLPAHVELIYGEKDRQYQMMYLKMSSRAHAITGCGHICHLENPKACAQAIRRSLC